MDRSAIDRESAEKSIEFMTRSVRDKNPRDRRRQSTAVLRGHAGEVEPRVVLHGNAQLRAVKWHDWKLHDVYAPDAGGPAIPR